MRPRQREVRPNICLADLSKHFLTKYSASESSRPLFEQIFDLERFTRIEDERAPLAVKGSIPTKLEMCHRVVLSPDKRRGNRVLVIGFHWVQDFQRKCVINTFYRESRQQHSIERFLSNVVSRVVKLHFWLKVYWVLCSAKCTRKNDRWATSAKDCLLLIQYPCLQPIFRSCASGWQLFDCPRWLAG